MDGGPAYLLDTGTLVHMTREDETGQQIRATYGPLITAVTPGLCVVTHGEIRSLAYEFS